MSGPSRASFTSASGFSSRRKTADETESTCLSFEPFIKRYVPPLGQEKVRVCGGTPLCSRARDRKKSISYLSLALRVSDAAWTAGDPGGPWRLIDSSVTSPSCKVQCSTVTSPDRWTAGWFDEEAVACDVPEKGDRRGAPDGDRRGSIALILRCGQPPVAPILGIAAGGGFHIVDRGHVGVGGCGAIGRAPCCSGQGPPSTRRTCLFTTKPSA